MSTPLWGEREPLARAREDRRAPGRSFTPSPPLYRWWWGGVGWWCGGPTATIDIPTFLCYGTTQGTPGSFIIWQGIILPRALCPRICLLFCRVAARRVAFVFVPVLVRGSRRIVVWYSVLACCMFDNFPAVLCVSRPGSVWFAFLYGAFTLYLFPVVFQAAPGDPVPLRLI